jgi:hypothetical protein
MIARPLLSHAGFIVTSATVSFNTKCGEHAQPLLGVEDDTCRNRVVDGPCDTGVTGRLADEDGRLPWATKP